MVASSFASLSQVETLTEIVPTGLSTTMAENESSSVVVSQANISFDKAIHSKNGLPTCAACDLVFTRWSGLVKHVTRGYCTVLSPLTGPADITVHQLRASHASVAICERPEVRRLLTNGVQALLQQQALLTEMRQHCVLCRQWIADTKVMKNHYNNSHKSFMREYKLTCLQYMRSHGVTSQPCTFCGSLLSNKAEAAKHQLKCTVLWQISVLLAWLQGHTDRASTDIRTSSDGGVLWRSQHDCQQTTNGGRLLQSNQASTSGTQRRQGCRLKQRFKGPPQGYYKLLADGDRRHGGGLSSGLSSSLAKHGLHTCPSSGHGNSLVCSNIPADGGSNAVRSCHEVERRCQPRATECGRPTSAQGSSLHDDDTHLAQGAQGGRKGRGASRKVPVLGLVGQGVPLGVSEVGSGYPHPTRRHKPSVNPNSRHDSECAGHLGPHHSTPCPASVPQHKAFVPGPTGNCSSPHGCIRERDPRNSLVPATLESSEQCSVATHWASVQARGSSSVAAGSEAPGVGIRIRSVNPRSSSQHMLQDLLTQAILANTGTYCYLNSWIRSLAWASVCSEIRLHCHTHLVQLLLDLLSGAEQLDGAQDLPSSSVMEICAARLATQQSTA